MPTTIAVSGGFAAELRGGVSGAIVALGILLPLGLLSFAALGAEAGAVGIRAAFATAIIGGIVTTMIGGVAVPGSGPKTATTLIFASFVATLAADSRLHNAQGYDIETMLVLTSLCVCIAGVLQVAFAMLRLGSIAAFVPVPVVAGFMNGIALYTAARAVFPDASFGPLVGAPSVTAIVANVPNLPIAPGIISILRSHLPQLLTTSMVIALVGSVDALVSAIAVDLRLHTRHDSNQMLLGQGLGSIACGIVGGLPVVCSSAIQFASHRAGGRGRTSGWVAAVVLLLVLLLGRPALGLVPVAVAAGVMLVVALGLFDQWSHALWRQLRSGSRDRDTLWTLSIVVIVCIITIAFGFVAAIAIGVVLSMVMFISALNRSLLRSVITGKNRGSRRFYPPDQERALREFGARIRVIELEGALFFGTAHRLRREIDTPASGARQVIVDLRRVTTIDASGALALEHVASRIRAQGGELLLAGLTAGDHRARALRALGYFPNLAEATWFADADRALEYAEQKLLDDAGARLSHDEVPLSRSSLCDGMEAAQQALLEPRLSRVELDAGDVLFRRGEPGDRLYVLAKGSVSLLAGEGSEAAAAPRIASFAPGVVFGEAAMLCGGSRSTTCITDLPTVVYSLTRADLDVMREREPVLAGVLLMNLARGLSARLRFAAAAFDAGDR
ncbi:MAG: SLC26A/SulP transporter family protein [Burkholderiales bacterium]|nr:SLC26A/SulP transporter family protein [Burkholderiales bacterium]